MFRPSRPMMRPFMSSLGSSTTDEVVSAAWLAATRWSASATRLRARRLASSCASSSRCLTRRAELVADSAAARRGALRLVDGQTRDPLELAELPVLRLLQVDLELLDVRLAVGEALFAAEELGQLRLELILLGEDALLELRDLAAALLGVALGLGTDAHRLLARLDLGLAAQVVGFPLRVVDQLVASRGGLPEARPAQHLHHHEQESRSEDEADNDSGGDEHGLSWGRLPHHQARAERSDSRPSATGRTGGAASELASAASAPSLVGVLISDRFRLVSENVSVQAKW